MGIAGNASGNKSYYVLLSDLSQSEALSEPFSFTIYGYYKGTSGYVNNTGNNTGYYWTATAKDREIAGSIIHGAESIYLINNTIRLSFSNEDLGDGFAVRCVNR